MTDHDNPQNEKIVLDTSIWIAKALTPGGAADAAIKKALENYTPVGSRETMAELERKLIREPPKQMVDKAIPIEARIEVLKQAQAATKILDVTNKQELCRDPKDNMFIQLAVDSGAKQVVTYDKDLSVLDKVQGIQMYKAKEFLPRERELDQRREVFRGDVPPQAENSIKEPSGPRGPKPDERDAQKLPASDSVDELAASYAQANLGSGASAERYREAAYFAHAVENSDKYPPRDDEMRERVEQRQFEEQFEKNYRKGSGEASREENKQEFMQERMQSYMDRQKQYTM